MDQSIAPADATVCPIRRRRDPEGFASTGFLARAPEWHNRAVVGTRAPGGGEVVGEPAGVDR